MLRLEDVNIAVIGLGYVGLPLAVELGKIYPTTGYDLDAQRIADLESGYDRNGEIDPSALNRAERLRLSGAPDAMSDCNFYIVTVPTPVDQFKRPEWSALVMASETVGALLRKGDVVVFECTVYPGATEEVCIPILERASGLKLNQGFFAGYSPERMNPGDKNRSLSKITKVTSGSTPECADLVDAVYASVVKAGTHRASSIRVAEAAKVIENIQRDVNIALVNELALIFDKLGLDTLEVLEAAGTKWNFLPFKPGLVGGHCIGVDPYYLTHKATAVGYHPEVILAGRRINDQMGTYVADRVLKMMMANPEQTASPSRVLVLGLAFKEDCADIRNTGVLNVAAALESYGVAVDVYDPRVRPEDVPSEFGLSVLPQLAPADDYDGIILAVAHEEFRQMQAEQIRALGRPGAVFFDLKGAFPAAQSDGRL
ncbi:MAG: nucleotide sugar dehydrogenase [Roseitalea sp.]|nr:nucleotide sugar dehydrogenase [Roseitalea sp.]MBO6950919.1 nucleotide sugar dehydrogenase [Rhizobiaceae bacterium]MBO6591094.1 nucleotide sugar dehydrogenase [Roseitalea sp.]MBO6599648.1 nucleotide sugar dehydrogenase [Roseitalea sp.]MBO6613899.1 nucleotide sugar dehydrogenase [Roseitalea sp.]